MKQKVPVTMRSVIQRVNRRVKSDHETLKTTRGDRLRQEVGDYYTINLHGNWIARKHIDPEALAREIGVLQPWEEVR